MTEATGQGAAASAPRSGRFYAIPALVAVGLLAAAGIYVYETKYAPSAGDHAVSGPATSTAMTALKPSSQKAATAQPDAAQPTMMAAAAKPPSAAQAAPESPAPAIQPAASQPAGSPPAVPTPAAPGVDVVRVDQHGSLVMAGRAQPGETLAIRNGATLLGTVTADADGQWVFLPDAALPSGVHQLSVSDQAAGSGDAAAQTTVLLNLPGKGGGAATASVGGKPLASGPMVVLSQGNTPPRLLLAPPGSHPGPVGLDVVQYDDQGRIRFTGHSQPGRTVRLYVNNQALGDAVADNKGIWSLSPSRDMPPGVYDLRTDELGPHGKVLARSEVPFARATLSQVLAPGQAVVQPGDCLWTIARHDYGRGVAYTAIFFANLDQIRDPDRIYPGQSFHMPTAAEAAHAPPISAVKAFLRNGRHIEKPAGGETGGGQS